MSSDGLDRRGFLALAGAGGLALFISSAGRAQASSSEPTMTVWQLDPDWGYPRGPHAKTRLVSRASRGAAQNRFALSEQDALAMNLHLCSFAPALARTVCAATFVSLWERQSYQWTNPWSGTVVRVLDRRHLSAADATRLDGTCGPITGQPVGLPTGVGAAHERDEPGGVFPVTGGPHRELAAAGVTALIGGAVMIRRAGHRANDPATESDPGGAASR